MSHPTRVFILRRISAPTLEWPVCCMGGDRKATLIFSSRESAERFAQWKEAESEWESFELPASECRPWLEANCQGGVSEVVIDPSPDDNQHRIVPLFFLLIEQGK